MKKYMITYYIYVLILMTFSEQLYSMLTPTSTALKQSSKKELICYGGLGIAGVGIGYIAYKNLQAYHQQNQVRPYVIELRKRIQEAPDVALFAESVHLERNLIVLGDDYAERISAKQIELRKKQILNNPLSLLRQNELAQWHYQHAALKLPSQPGEDPLDTYLSGSRSGAEIASFLNKSICEENAMNPLSMLDECTETRCRLTRSLDSTKAREHFAAVVVNEIEKQAEINDSSVTYVDVGSGGCFQNLVILTKAIEQTKHIKKLNVVLIDESYNYEAYLRDGGRSKPQKLDYRESSMQRMHAQFAQFARWFDQAYPTIAMHCYIHKSVNEYSEHAQQNPHLQADIYLGIDLDKSSHVPPLSAYIERLATVGDRAGRKNGHEAYLSADLSKIMKPTGVGLMLLKDYLPQAPGLRNHYIKLHAQGTETSHVSMPVNSDYPELHGRLVTLEKSYSTWVSWFKNKAILLWNRK